MKNNKKIAFLIEKFVDIPIGGEPTINLNLINFLEKNGYEIDIYCKIYEKSENKNNFRSVFPDFLQNQEIYLNQIKNNNYDLIIGSKFALKFKEIHADLYTIHSHSDLYSAKSRLGILYNIIKSKQKRIKTEINNLCFNRNAKYIFCSEQLAQDYTSLGDLKDVTIINPYPNWKPDNDHIISKNKTFTFGISATGFQNKGGYLFLKAAFLLKLTGRDFKLKIIYKEKSGVLQNILITLLGLKKYVEFIPKQADMHNFYESIDCLVMPSFVESFGMVAIEAMNFGLPVIVSSTSGAKSTIKNGVNGFVFDFKKNRLWNLFSCMKEISSQEFLESFSSDNSELMNEEKYNKDFLKQIINASERKCI